MPAAFLINHGAHGYGKFVYDEATLKTFQTKLGRLESSLDRKQAYLFMYDMIKSKRIAASRVLAIILGNVESEAAEDILQELFKSLVPTLVGKYLPIEDYESTTRSLFELSLKMLASGRYTASSTKELIVDQAISFSNGPSLELVLKWFMTDKVTDPSGKEVTGLELSLKRKHQMIEKIFTSRTISAEQKRDAFAKLQTLDQTDTIEKTRKFCEAATPSLEAKKQVWDSLMEMKEDPGVTAIIAYGRGLRQLTQLDILDKFADAFFEKIEAVVATQGQGTADKVYMFLQPNLRADEKDIARYNKFLAKL